MNLTTCADVALIHTLRRQAREAGMFVVEKSDTFLLYRETHPHNVLIGRRASLAGLKRLLARTTRTH